MKKIEKKDKSITVNKPPGPKNKTRETKHARASQRRKAKGSLTQNEENVLALLNAYGVAALLTDTKGVILTANTTLAKQAGKSVDELISTSAYDLLPPDLHKTRSQKIKEIIRTGELIRFVDERNGMFFKNTLYPVKDSEGKVARIAAYSRDITKETQAEKSLQTSEERYRTLIELMKEGVWVIDADHRTAFVNPQIAVILGYTSDEIR